MTYSLRLRLPEELRYILLQTATALGQTPEEWAAALIRRQLTQRDEKLRRHLGAVDMSTPADIENESIDRDPITHLSPILMVVVKILRPGWYRCLRES